MKSKLLIIGLVWPEPETTAAGSRMLQLIGLFEGMGMDIHFASTAAETRYSSPLRERGIRTHSIALNDSRFDEWIRELGPEIVVFDRFVTEEMFSWRVREQCPGALRILDTEDLHLLREARRIALLSEDSSAYDLLVNDISLRELGSIYRSDLTLVISEFEYDFLIKEFGMTQELLAYLPFLLSPGELSDPESFPPFALRRDFMSIGNWKHGPNKDAVLYLKDEIWPGIRKKIPDANLHIYGAYGESDSLELHDPDSGFLIRGWAESREEAFGQHRVCLAPLRYGAGLKGKLLDAMRFGTPSVTTAVGAEGMHGNLPWNGSIASEPDEFVKEAVALYQDESLWNLCQARGHAILKARFSRETFEVPFAARLNEHVKTLDRMRKKNFVGALLWHHSAQSTKYLSKWIEAKNANRRRDD